MKYSIDDVKRLIPEIIEVHKYKDSVTFCVDHSTEDGLRSDRGIGKLLLDTRRQLEIAREYLKLISGCAGQDDNTKQCVSFAEQALAAIEGITK